MMIIIYLYNFFFNLKYILNRKCSDSKEENTKHIYFNYVENFFIKPIFYVVSYILLAIILFLFLIVKIIKYIIELLMDFVDSDETKLYDRFIYNK